MSRSGLYAIIKIIKSISLIVKSISGTSGAGKRGEFAIKWWLNWLPKDEYFIINDLLIRNQYSSTIQIDHVVVSPYGIFVIETKNISGKIYGTDTAEKWRSYWKYRDLEFNNPILQNKAHVDALSGVLRIYPGVRFMSIIAFTSNANLRVQVKNANVMYSLQVPRYIRRFDTPVISTDTALQIYNYLLKLNIKDEEVRQSHAARATINMNNHKRRAEEKSENGICPKCGGKLVLRNGKFGSFYGCRNYPNCKYTRQA
jgi:hypothetical protein